MAAHKKQDAALICIDPSDLGANICVEDTVSADGPIGATAKKQNLFPGAHLVDDDFGSTPLLAAEGCSVAKPGGQRFHVSFYDNHAVSVGQDNSYLGSVVGSSQSHLTYEDTLTVEDIEDRHDPRCLRFLATTAEHPQGTIRGYLNSALKG